MENSNLSRRHFHKLTAVAFGGLVAGAGTANAEGDEKKPMISVDPALLLSEPHTCGGLNTCKGMGAGKDNACAGQGTCATVAKHGCGGENGCKGQGGCGGYPGQNACKGKGHCSVPLSKESWSLARKQFEHLMADTGKKVGKAPKAG